MKNVRDDLSTTTGSRIEVSDEVVFYSTVTFTELPEQVVSTVPLGETIPSVLNRTRLIFKNTTPVTVTWFTHGQEGQEVKILGDGNTTVKNNTQIKTNTLADKLLAPFALYTFTLIESIWYENA